MSVSILVVNDEPDAAELFRQRFRRETRQGKYVLHYAASGTEALDRLAGEIEHTLVAVLSDLNMPGMEGLQLLGEIKQRCPDRPVMMVTAYGDDGRRRRAAEYGAEFLTKETSRHPLSRRILTLKAILAKFVPILAPSSRPHPAHEP